MIAIGFSTGKHSIVSAIIRFITRSKVSHAYLIFDDPLLEDSYILEADKGGFQVKRYSIFKRHNRVVAEIVPDVPMLDAVRAADKWVGTVKYDYEGLVSTGIVTILHWLKMKWLSPIHAAHSMFCSAAMTKVLQLASYPPVRGWHALGVTPKQLYEAMEDWDPNADRLGSKDRQLKRES